MAVRAVPWCIDVLCLLEKYTIVCYSRSPRLTIVPGALSPDKNPGNKQEAEERFAEIGNAYEVLSQEREAYDHHERFQARFGFRGRQQQRHHHGGGFHHHHFQQQHQTRVVGLGDLLQVVPLLLVGYVAWSSLSSRAAAASSRSKKAGPGSDKTTPDASDVRADIFPSGTRVTVRGLRSRPELNGKRGGIQSYDTTKGRYIVQLDGAKHGEHTSLAASSVKQVVYRATVCSGEHHGQLCRVIGAVNSSEGGDGVGWCHCVELIDEPEGDEPPLHLAAGAVRLPEATRVEITGLRSRPELNGAWAELIRWDEDKSRYVVQLDSSKRKEQISLAPASVRSASLDW
jgi:hypothetical protein